MRASRAMVRHADMQSARALRLGAILTALSFIYGAAGATPGSVTLVTSFSVPKSPSGMFYQASSDVLWILCGTETNGDHYLYAYSTSGTQKCFATIPQSVGMSRVDGFYIVDSKAYIVDSQGPIYASTSGKLGGSVYEVDWTNPCGCAAGSCATSTVRRRHQVYPQACRDECSRFRQVTWIPTVTRVWAISATDPSIGDGGACCRTC